jgi:hypothetical protein
MTDLAAIKSRLSNPREVAAMLGLRTKRMRNGVLVLCPVHGEKTASLGLRVGTDGTIQAFCFGCGLSGDVLTLLAAIEGDFKRGLARAIELAGGAVGAPVQAWQPPEKCDPDVYHELAARILEAGKLDGRPWTREVGEYLEQRGLLELARADSWAALPSLGWLLQLAKEVCDERRQERTDFGNGERGTSVTQQCDNSVGNANDRLGGGKDLAPRSLLIAAKLAKINKRGEFVHAWKGWNLIIPWRGPDGRINALQRRRVTDGDGPKYVLPWAPEWPYGSERVGGYGLSSGDIKSRTDVLGASRDGVPQLWIRQIRNQSTRRVAMPCVRSSAGLLVKPIAIVEGAVDTLAMRAMHPAFEVLGIPGIGSWRASWASLVHGRGLRIALDRGKPGPDGIISEDRAAARIALDCSGRGQETDRVLEWWLSRWRRGRALGCVLCGAGEAWLCGGCGRRRAPVGSDWGGLWEARANQP